MKNEINLLKGLNKLFKGIEKITDEETNKINDKEYIGYMDKTYCNMIIPKTFSFKKILLENFVVIESKIPNIEYNNMEEKTFYSPQFLKILYEISKRYSDVIITAGASAPLQCETEDFIFIIAPIIKIESGGVKEC